MSLFGINKKQYVTSYPQNFHLWTLSPEMLCEISFGHRTSGSLAVYFYDDGRRLTSLPVADQNGMIWPVAIWNSTGNPLSYSAATSFPNGPEKFESNGRFRLYFPALRVNDTLSGDGMAFDIYNNIMKEKIEKLKGSPCRTRRKFLFVLNKMPNISRILYQNFKSIEAELTK